MEHSPKFYRLGKFIYKWHTAIILLWLALIIGCLPFLPHIMTPFKTVGFVDNTSRSAKADDFLEKKLGYGNQRIIIAYSSEQLESAPLFKKKIKHSLAKLRDYPIAHEIIYPSTHNDQFSENKYHAMAIVLFKTKEALNREEIDQFKQLIQTPTGMHITLGGEPIFVNDIDQQTKKDLYKADIIALPISILIMILVFGSLVAASLPIILGGICAIIILTSLYFLAQTLTLSIFTINISLLLGLCLSLDYSLFIMSRFKEELQLGKSIEEAIAITMSCAGRAIYFSGLAVFISLSALLIFPVSILFSIGIGGLTAVFFAVSMSVLLLPAVLSVVRHGVNWLPVRIFRHSQTRRHFWEWLASKVVKRPLLFFIPSLFFLLFLSMPFLNAKFGVSDEHILPEHSESRKFFDLYKKQFNEYKLTPIVVIASSTHPILAKKPLEHVYDLAEEIGTYPDVLEVNSIVSGNKDMDKQRYYHLYKMEQQHRTKEVNQVLKTTTGKHFTTLNIVSKYPVDSPQTKKLVKHLQNMTTYKDLELQVTGIPVSNADVMQKIKQLFPYALAWILVLTYLILLLLLHSLILPLKAIIMNIISLSASYGVLVFVFQEGHLHELLHFTPQGMLDTSLLIIIFCALFGFSMDYEVFLLTRMRECYDKTGDTNQSIVAGIDQSGRIITSAAVIVIVLCGSFMAAQVLMVQEFGLGIAIAIFVDAFLVRSLLVPSIMVLLKDWNWYMPQWMHKVLPNSSCYPQKKTRSKPIRYTKKR